MFIRKLLRRKGESTQNQTRSEWKQTSFHDARVTIKELVVITQSVLLVVSSPVLIILTLLTSAASLRATIPGGWDWGLAVGVGWGGAGVHGASLFRFR